MDIPKKEKKMQLQNNFTIFFYIFQTKDEKTGGGCYR